MAEKPQKPPSLTVVTTGSAQNAPNPPRKLGPAGESLWFRVQSEYRITDVGGVELLMQACLAADRVEALAAVIEADGERIMTKAGPKDHPCLKHELAARAFICKTLARLGNSPVGWVEDSPVSSLRIVPTVLWSTFAMSAILRSDQRAHSGSFSNLSTAR